MTTSSLSAPPPPTVREDAAAAAKAEARLRRRSRLGRLDVKISPYLYIAPFFILFLVIGMFPIVYTAFVSVHEWNTIAGQGDFVGLQNFADVLHQKNFYIALRNTFSIFLLSSVPQVIMAILLAAVLNANIRAKTFWRMGVLVPYIVAPVAVGLIFGKIFADQSGLANAILGLINVGPIGWHKEVLASHIAVSIMVNFRWTGYNTLIFLAAMQAIPTELYEAAIVDGAGRIRQFWSVTVPQLRSTIVFVVITSTIGGLQIFDEPRMFDQAGQGGASRQWMTVTMYLYELGWGNQKNFGRASAVAWLLFLIIVTFALLNFFLTQRISSSGSAKLTRKERRALEKRRKADAAERAARQQSIIERVPAGRQS